jgi:hypothetical protein
MTLPAAGHPRASEDRLPIRQIQEPPYALRRTAIKQSMIRELNKLQPAWNCELMELRNSTSTSTFNSTFEAAAATRSRRSGSQSYGRVAAPCRLRAPSSSRSAGSRRRGQNHGHSITIAAQSNVRRPRLARQVVVDRVVSPCALGDRRGEGGEQIPG